MKKKKWTMLFLMLCVCSMLCVLPASAKAKPAPKRLTLSRKNVTLYVGEVKPLFVEKVRPADASAKVLWKVKNRQVADVSPKGEVKAKKAGKTTVWAVSKRDQKITASVCITVRKRPKKTETACAAAGKFFSYDDTGLSVRMLLKAGGDEFVVLRDKEDFLEVKKAINANSKWIGGLKFKKSCLKEYETTDFSKESLIVIAAATYAAHGHQILSCTTELDQEGALCGVVKVSYKKTIDPPGTARPCVMDENTIVLRMNKKDEARIDYFKVEMVEADE